MSPVPLVPSPCSSPSVALATFLCVTGQEEPRCRPAPSRGHTGTPSGSSPGSGSSAGCPPLSGLPWSQGWWAPAALSAPCAPSWPLTHSPAVALLRLPISMNKCVAPGPLFAASLMGALHRPGAQAAGRSRLSGTPSVGPRSPAQPPPWHVGESLGAATGPLPGGRAYFRSALLLAVVCTGSGGAASGWSRYLSHMLPREPLQRRGLGPGPHVVQSPTGSYFLPLRLAVRLTAGSLCLYHQGLGWPVSTQTCRRPSPVESGQQLLPAQPHALPPSQAVKLGEWPGLLRPGWPF